MLTALDDLGVPVVFTTGRPIRWMETLWADVGGHGLAICSNGGLVYDVAAHEVRSFRSVPRAIGLEIAGAGAPGRGPGDDVRARAHAGLGVERTHVPAPPR